MLFISTQKLFSFSRYLRSCLNDLVMQRNGLIKKIRSIPKFITSQPGKQAIIISVLLNILRRKDNQEMKFGHLR